MHKVLYRIIVRKYYMLSFYKKKLIYLVKIL
jgi:hypothetical protein